MREMKQSGIEWVGKIPAHWEITKLKTNFTYEKGKNAALYTKEYVGLHKGNYPVYSGQTENNGIMGTIDTFDYDLDECVFSTTVGAKVMTPMYLSGKFSLSQNCLIMKPIGTYLCKMLYYCLEPLFDCERELIPSYMQPSLRFSDLNKYCLPQPPIPEQQAIADYLDGECARIDGIVTTQRQIIERLKEYKKSVITEVVTRGLNPDVPMKDSGIEWIGKIPEHWEVRRIKTLGEYRNGLTYNPENMVDESNGTLVLRSSNIQNGKIVLDDNVFVNTIIPEQLLVHKGDIIICSRNGSRELVGKNALIKEDIMASFGAFMMIFRTNYPEYISYILNSAIFSYYLSTFFTATINQLTGSNFGNMQIVFCPDLNEQQEIIDYLDGVCARIDTIIEKRERMIELMTEYKKSLIYECVTGKKEIVDVVE
ncbi:MAG: restriction endonuclease subunit S [Alphaproteobacteria bacterium]|nr:restriction endonuclease subunit S [Alphaproteobacteria bacterium]